MRKLLLMLALSCLPVLRAESQSVRLSGTGQLQEEDTGLFGTFTVGNVFFSATLRMSPVPDFEGATEFWLQNVLFSFTQGGTTIDKSGVFKAFSSGSVGGFNFEDLSGNPLLDVFGSGSPPEQIFSGTTTAPTFVVGTYAAEDPFGAVRPTEFRIAATVPEPSTYLLVATGLAVFALAVRRRRQA